MPIAKDMALDNVFEGQAPITISCSNGGAVSPALVAGVSHCNHTVKNEARPSDEPTCGCDFAAASDLSNTGAPEMQGPDTPVYENTNTGPDTLSI